MVAACYPLNNASVYHALHVNNILENHIFTRNQPEPVLQTAYSPDGLNMGMNLGRAGAGVPDHHHFHLVPRWIGDTNFASVVGGIRLVPEDLESTWRRLRSGFEEES